MEPKELVLALLSMGLTQQQIADKTGVAQPTISKVARGDIEDVLSRNYRRLEALHKSMVRRRKAEAA